jgi:hypothetical protein
VRTVHLRKRELHTFSVRGSWLFVLAALWCVAGSAVAHAASDRRSRCAGQDRCGTICRLCNAGCCRADADTKIRSQRKEIEELRGKVRAGDAQRKAELTAAEEKYVAALAVRDRAYAQEIAVFRKAVED